MTFDREIFTTLNEQWHTPFLDALMPFLTNLNKTIGFWVVVVLLLIAFWKGGGQRGRVVVVLLAVMMPGTDVFSSQVAKRIYYRRRPCCPIAYVAGSGSPTPASDLRTATLANSEIPGDRILPPGAHPLTSSSFPSSHSATMASLATILVWAFRKRTKWVWLALLLPLVIGYSRIYVGVHYPTDVLGGWLLGFGLAALACRVASHWEQQQLATAQNRQD